MTDDIFLLCLSLLTPNNWPVGMQHGAALHGNQLGRDKQHNNILCILSRR